MTEKKFCSLCKKVLIPTKELGYLHPPPKDGENPCEEWDGVFMEQDVRYEWNKKYGIPKKNYYDLEKELKTLFNNYLVLQRREKKCQKKIIKLKTHLKRNEQKDKENLAKQKWKRIFEKWKNKLTKKTLTH